MKTHLFLTLEKLEKRALFNQEKVLNAFHHVKASESDLQGSTGYGYDDFGRDHLEQIYAHTFKADDALVRPQIISGTHAITLALQSTLKTMMNYFILQVVHMIHF